jgi:hypothetical protein
MRTLAFLTIFMLCIRPFFCEASENSPISQLEESCNLPAPTGVEVQEISTTYATGVWNPVQNADGYLVKVNEVGNSNFVLNTIIDVPTIFISGLKSATKYQLSIQSVCGNGSAGSPILSVFQTDFIIIDIVVAERKNVQPWLGQGSLPLKLVLKKAGLLDENFDIYKIGDEVYVGHDNINCMNTYTAYEAEHHAFGNMEEYPPLNGLQHNAEKVGVYYFEECTSELTVQNSNATIFVSKIPNSYPEIYSVSCNSQLYSLWEEPSIRKRISEEEQEIVAKPNPIAGDELELTIPYSDYQSVIKIVDFSGKVVETRIKMSGDVHEIISTDKLLPGVYVIQVESAGNFYTKKIVKI